MSRRRLLVEFAVFLLLLVVAVALTVYTAGVMPSGDVDPPCHEEPP